MTGRTRRAAGRRGAVLVALIAVVALPGCWLQIGAGPGHTRYQPFDGGLTAANVDTLHELWSVEVPGSLSEPMVSEGRVFVTRTQPYSTAVRAVDATTGATLWDSSLVAVPAVSGAFASGTPVTFVGERLWSGFIGYVPFAPGGGTPACTLGTSEIDPATGATSSGGFSLPGATVSSGPVRARVLLSVPTPRPCSLSNPTITLEVSGSSGGGWTTTIPSAPPALTAPTLTGDRVLLAHGASLDSYAIDGCTEDCLQWTRTLSPEPSVPVVDGSGPIFVRTGAFLLALDQADGATLWRAPLGGSVGGSVAVADGTVYVASLAATGEGVVLQAFAADGCGGVTTCEPRWEASFDGTAGGDPLVGGDVVYVADGDSIVAFDAAGCGAATCGPLADVAVADYGRLALSNGRLFLATDGLLTALGAA